MFEGGTIFEDTLGGQSSLKFKGSNGAEQSYAYGEGKGDLVMNASGWALKNDWKQHAEFQNGGRVVFKTITEGTSGAKVIERLFREAFGEGAVLEFAPYTGSAVVTEVTKDLFNEVLASNPGATFYETDYEGGGSALSIGDAENGISGSTGFRSLSGVTDLSVKAGKSLRLVGDNSKVLSEALRTAVSGTFTVEAESRFRTETTDVTGGVISVRGVLDSVAARLTSGQIGVFQNAKAHFASLDAAGTVGNNRGTLVADAGTVTGTVKSSGLTSIGAYEGAIGSTFAASPGTTLMVESFNTNGVVRADGATIVIGTAAKARYLLAHLDEAQKIVDAGGTVDQSVLDALEARAAGTSEESATTLELARPSAGDGGDSAAEVSADTTAGESAAPSREEAVTDSAAEPAETEESDIAEGAAEAGIENQETSGEPDEDDVEEHTPAADVGPAELTRNADSRAGVLRKASMHGAAVFAAWNSAREEAVSLGSAALSEDTGLRAELLSGRAEFDAYRTTRNGVRMGLQRADDDLTLGVQAAYADGKVKFGTDRSRAEASFGVYGRYHLGDAFVTGFAGYGHGRTEVTEASDIRTDSLFGGFMLGADVAVSEMTFTPHIGMVAYRIKADDANDVGTIEFPIGFSMRGRLATASGWRFMPNSDITFVIHTGDRTVATVESGFSAESVFTAGHRTEASLGLRAQKGPMTLDAVCSGAFGDSGFKSYSLNVRAMYEF